MLVVTYSCEHNHPWPVSRNHHNNNNHNNNHHSTVKPDTKPEILNVKPDPEPVPEETFADLGNESSLIISTNNEFRWFRQGTVVAECVRQGRQASSVFFF